jgi:hypothetical protein
MQYMGMDLLLPGLGAEAEFLSRIAYSKQAGAGAAGMHQLTQVILRKHLAVIFANDAKAGRTAIQFVILFIVGEFIKHNCLLVAYGLWFTLLLQLQTINYKL